MGQLKWCLSLALVCLIGYAVWRSAEASVAEEPYVRPFPSAVPPLDPSIPKILREDPKEHGVTCVVGNQVNQKLKAYFTVTSLEGHAKAHNLVVDVERLGKAYGIERQADLASRLTVRNRGFRTEDVVVSDHAYVDFSAIEPGTTLSYSATAECRICYEREGHLAYDVVRPTVKGKVFVADHRQIEAVEDHRRLKAEYEEKLKTHKKMKAAHDRYLVTQSRISIYRYVGVGSAIAGLLAAVFFVRWLFVFVEAVEDRVNQMGGSGQMGDRGRSERGRSEDGPQGGNA